MITRFQAVRIVAVALTVISLKLQLLTAGQAAATSGAPGVPEINRLWDLERIFHAADVNGDDQWSIAELRNYVRSLDVSEETIKPALEPQIPSPLQEEQRSTTESLIEMFQALDSNLDNRLSMEEAATIFSTPSDGGVPSNVTGQNTGIENSNLEDWFHRVDKDQDGFLSQEEFYKGVLAHSDNDHEAGAVAGEVIAQYDNNNDGVLDFEEFFAAAEIGSESALISSDPQSFTVEELQELRTEFAQHDADGDGFLNHAELIPFFIDETGDSNLSDVTDPFDRLTEEESFGAPSSGRQNMAYQGGAKAKGWTTEGAGSSVGPEAFSASSHPNFVSHDAEEQFVQQFFQVQYGGHGDDDFSADSPGRTFSKVEVVALLENYGPKIDFLLPRGSQGNSGSSGGHLDELR